jgi:DHA2 family multidrug resistance protein-like MFS transporter
VAAISETSSEFGGALGIAVLGSIGAAVYRSEINSSIPVGLSPEVGESARSTLGGAAAAAEQLAGPLSLDLVAAAGRAFTQSLELVAFISAALLLVTAVIVSFVLRDVQTGGEQEPEAPGVLGDNLDEAPVLASV